MSKAEDKARTTTCPGAGVQELFGTSELANQERVTQRMSHPETAVHRFAVKRLTLTDFRNYRNLRLDTPAGMLVFTGDNGVGKTNLLEAVSFLVPGRGLRRSKLSDIAWREGKTGGNAWAVTARLETPKGPCDVGTGLELQTGGDTGGNSGERRAVKIDGETQRSQSALSGSMSAHWLTPQMDRLFQEGSSARRRFLDRMVFGWDSAHAGRVTAYEQAMRQRMKLLRDDRSTDSAWLSALEETMALKGIAVAVARLDVAARLSLAAKDGWGPFPGVDVAVQGDLEGWLAEGPALVAEDKFRASLETNRAGDRRSGRTRSGPQRSDLIVKHRPKELDAALCSTGEQKALLTGLVLANARTRAAEEGGVPVLLLDEVAAHLDEERRTALFDALFDLGCQAWLTGTDTILFEPLRGRADFFTVDAGSIKCTG